jgi:formyl-CoA transferase
MLEAAVSFVPDAFSNFTRMQIDNQPRTRVASSQSYAFRCADGKLLALHLSSPQKFWESLLDVVERPDLKTDVRFATRDARIRNYAILEEKLAKVIGSKDRLHWITKLDRADVPFAPVQTVSEVLDDPQIKHLETFYQQKHPTEGLLTLIRRPILIDGNRDIQSRPPPVLGEHTREILQELSAMKSNPKTQKS